MRSTYFISRIRRQVRNIRDTASSARQDLVDLGSCGKLLALPPIILSLTNTVAAAANAGHLDEVTEQGVLPSGFLRAAQRLRSAVRENALAFKFSYDERDSRVYTLDPIATVPIGLFVDHIKSVLET